jgi:hypothetical protein
MNISTADVDGGARDYEVEDIVNGPGGSFFRRTLKLRFNTAGAPDRVIVVPENTMFSAAFSGKVYDVRNVKSSFPTLEDLKAKDGAIVVTLSRPWKIKRIVLSFESKEIFDFNDVWACALPVGEETEKVSFNGKTQPVYIPEIDVELYRVDAEAIAAEPSVTGENGKNFLIDFIADKFAIKAKGAGAPKALHLDNLLKLEIQTYPTGPRIGISEPAKIPADYLPLGYFWQVSGEIKDPSREDFPNEAAGERLAAALQRYFDDLLTDLNEEAARENRSPAIPDLVEVALVCESDAPCDLSIDLDIAYWLVRDSFSIPEGDISAPEKQVLHFNGERLISAGVNITLPRSINIQSATLNIDASFGLQPSVALKNILQLASSDQNTGAFIGQDRWIAQGVELREAASITGIALSVMAIDTETELSVELQEDWNDRPSGKKLAEARVPVPYVGRRELVRADFQEAITLYTAPFWLILKATRGAAIWNTRPAPEAVMKAYRRHDHDAASAHWVEFKNMSVDYSLFSNSINAIAENPLISLSIGGLPPEPLNLVDNVLSVSPQHFKSALSTILSDVSPTASSVTILLSFTTVASGFITVYPPHIEFGLSETPNRADG